ncbi:MAG: hypothetical protein NT105_19200 [Verrucomicrobia bacterium]|nr:hypothetical protein [Verrucomicrobiota bacterium]
MNQRIHQLLGSLRWLLRLHLALGGLSRVGAVGVAAALGTWTLDWWLRLDWGPRGLLGTLALIIIGVAGWRWFLRPMIRRFCDTDVALALERAFPQFGDRLLTVVEDGRGKAEVSPALLERVAAEAAEIAAGVRPLQALDHRRLARCLALGVGALLVIAIVAAFFPQELEVWWQRDVLLRNVEWPHATMLEISGFPNGTARVVRGAPFNILVTASGWQIPETVKLVLDYEHAGRFREVLTRVGNGKFAKRFDSVIESFRFRAFGGDGATGELRVEVVDPPMLRNVRMRLVYPAYTRQPPREIGPSDGAVESVVGTRLELRATSTRPLRYAKLQIPNSKPQKLASSVMDARVEAATNVSAQFVIKESGRVQISIEDMEGLRADPALSFALDAQPDRPPLVRLTLSGIGDKITPVATLPVAAEAHDDFGVAALSLATSTNNTTWQSQPLAGAALGNAEVHLETRLPVESLRVAEGSVLNIRVEATDAATPPGCGASQSLALRVVSAAELMADLNRRQKEYRAEFERLTRKHREALDALRVIREGAAAGKQPDLVQLSPLVADEREVGNGCQTMSELFLRILDEMKNNRVGTPTEQERLRARVVGPLTEASRQLLGPVVTQLGAVTPSVSAPLGPAFEQAQVAYNQMRTILAEMMRGETLSDAVAALREILKDQSQLNEATRKALEVELQRLLKSP